MAYQTLYRKYRPKTFSDIVGQGSVVKVLSNAIIHSKIAHAYLFCGPRGTGKTSMAKIFARIINCKNLDGVNPCGKCECCRQIENKNFMDIIEIDAASNNGVDEIREIKNKVNLAPNTGKYKVYIIDEVHMLSIGAFNALLKTLEEPPAHIIFILATTEPQKLPITVISRCQRFDFKRFLNSEIVDNLKKICNLEKLNYSEDILNEIAYLSDGGMRDAIGLLDQLSLYDEGNVSIDDLYQLAGCLSRKSEIEFFKNYFDGNIMYCLDQLKLFESEGKNFSKIVVDFVDILENILKYKVIDGYTSEKDVNYRDLYLNMSKNVSCDVLYNLIEKICDIEKSVKNISNPRIMLEMCLLMEYNGHVEQTYVINDIKTDKPTNNIDLSGDSSGKIDKKPENIVSKNKEISLNSDEIQNIKMIRINNTFVDANKNILNELKNKYSLIMEYMFDDNYSFLVLNLQDSEIRVAGSKNVIISVSENSTVDILNEKIYLLDELLSKVFGCKYKCIVISNVEWNKLKIEYVNSIKENKVYSFIEEVTYSDDKIVKKNENSDLEGIFGSDINDIIEIR